MMLAPLKHLSVPWHAVLALASTLAACAPVSEPAFDERAPAGLLDDVTIADPDEALTFARSRDRVLLVTSYRGGVVRGVDLARVLGRPVDDPATVYGELGYDRLRDLARPADPSTVAEVKAEDLVIPLALGGHHVAAATNFPEHAGDAGVEDGPFLFAKIVEPTGPYDPIPAGNGLLDYEVEVAWVPLGPLAEGAPEPAMGLVLCNDVTDRATLLRHVDPWDVVSGDGFATGKSFPGFLPVGNLFVVPRDHRRFVAGLELRLYVDGALRQRSPATEMVWDHDAILANTWAWKDRRWDHRGTQVSLLGDGRDAIAPRAMILSGTPHGTVFDGMRTRHYLRGVGAWLLGGWGEPVPRHVVEDYIDDARASGVYLQPGDVVEIHVERLGVLRNRVVASGAAS